MTSEPHKHFDIALVNRLLSHDSKEKEKAWKEFYEANYRPLRTLLIEHGVAVHAVGDLYNESFEALLNNIASGRFRYQSRLSTYFLAIGKFKCYKSLKKRDRVSINVDPTTLEAIEQDVVEHDPEYDKLLDLMVDIFETKLLPECQKILRKYYFEGYSMAELLFEDVVTSVQAMKNKKYRCVKLLRRIVDEHCQDPEILRKWKQT